MTYRLSSLKKTVKPVLLYGSEIWGFGNFDCLEKIQIKYYKYIFHLKKSTPSYMIYGETGVTPLYVNIKNRVIAYWTRLLDNIYSDQVTKLSSKMYLVLRELHSERNIKSPWIDNVKKYLCELGFSGTWYSQSFLSSKWLIMSTYQKLKDTFIQTWYSDLNRTSETNIYKFVKSTFSRSFYIDNLPTFQCKSLIQYLTRNHCLPIETGRWQNNPIVNRKCNECGSLGDEYHYLFECSVFEVIRRKYVDSNLRIRPSMHKFVQLIHSTNSNELHMLANFCKQIITHFRN